MKIELTGYNLEELIKTLYRKKIVIQHLIKHNNTYISFDIYDKDYKKVKRYIKNYKVKSGLTKRKKISKFFIGNIGLVLGVFIGIIFAIFASNYIWQIKIYGTQNLSNAQIIDVLKENGISVGKLNLKSTKQIEDILLNKYDRIAQVSIIKHGTAIIINLSEKLVYNNQQQNPIVANYAGIITQVNVLKGIANVKVGDYVNKGDVLVLPFNLDNAGNKVYVTPLAEIKANIYVTGGCKLNKNEQVFVKTGKKITTYNYMMYNKKLFSGKNKNSFALFITKVYNESVSNIIPLYRQVVEYHELTTDIVKHDFTQEKQVLIDKSYQQALQQLPTSYTLIDKYTKVDIIDDIMYANTIICIQGIIHD